VTGSFLTLQQATRVAEQHLPVIRQRDAACRAPEQGGGDPRTKTPLASGNESDLATGYGRLTRSERRSRMHPVLLQKVYKGAHLRQKQAVAQG
jgi:hypothetical protein